MDFIYLILDYFYHFRSFSSDFILTLHKTLFLPVQKRLTMAISNTDMLCMPSYCTKKRTYLSLFPHKFPSLPR